MTKRALLKQAREVSREFQKRSEWKPGLTDEEKHTWWTILALIYYVEEH